MPAYITASKYAGTDHEMQIRKIVADDPFEAMLIDIADSFPCGAKCRDAEACKKLDELAPDGKEFGEGTSFRIVLDEGKSTFGACRKQFPMKLWPRAIAKQVEVTINEWARVSYSLSYITRSMEPMPRLPSSYDTYETIYHMIKEEKTRLEAYVAALTAAWEARCDGKHVPMPTPPASPRMPLFDAVDGRTTRVVSLGETGQARA